MNSYCSWLKDEGHIAEAVVLKQLRAQTRVITIITPAQVRTILANKPKCVSYLRT